MQSPKLQLYNKIFEIIQGCGERVIDFKDMTSEIPYPFFVVSEVETKKSNDTFNTFSSNLVIKVHLWSLGNDRYQHDEYEDFIDYELSFLGDLDGYQIILDTIHSNTVIDNTTNQEILHTVVTAEYKVF